MTEISRPSPALVKVLKREATSKEWVLAVVGGDPAAGYQLAAHRPVMAIGGWRGTDPVPTLRCFQSLVREGKIGYFVPAGPTDGVFVPRSQARAPAREISIWVRTHFVATMIGGQQLFDLSRPLRRAPGSPAWAEPADRLPARCGQRPLVGSGAGGLKARAERSDTGEVKRSHMEGSCA